MPCYQSTNLPSGVTATGRTSYTTEADCLNACKEGACCEGTSCTVKPQCQCQGEGKYFQGIGTKCENGTCLCCKDDWPQNQKAGCSAVSPCWCICGEGSAPYPRFVNVSFSFKYDVYRLVSSRPAQKDSREKNVSGATITLTSAGGWSREECPSWSAGRPSFGVITDPVPLGGTGVEGAFQLVVEEVAGTGSLRWRLSGAVQDFSERPWATTIDVFTSDGLFLRDAAYGLGGSGGVGGPYRSGTCFSNMSPFQSSSQGLLRDFSFTINGVQA